MPSCKFRELLTSYGRNRLTEKKALSTRYSILSASSGKKGGICGLNVLRLSRYK